LFGISLYLAPERRDAAGDPLLCSREIAVGDVSVPGDRRVVTFA